ncbi:MAG TPA: hypothetical protein VMA36_21605 [Candidatus Limnocylindria bacterium]|nr:hypothetical protein [Candidatus Limnocylindria bacterium]
MMERTFASRATGAVSPPARAAAVPDRAAARGAGGPHRLSAIDHASERGPLQRVVTYGKIPLTPELIERDLPALEHRAQLVLILRGMILAHAEFALLDAEHLAVAAEGHRLDFLARLGGAEALRSGDPRNVAALLDQPARPNSFAHFTTGAPAAAVGFTDKGDLVAPGEKRKASGVEKKKVLRQSLGIGEHVLAGHFFDDKTLLSQLMMGKSNFTWTSEQALLEAIELGRRVFAEDAAFENDDAKDVVVELPPGAGHGFVSATDGKVYRVVPRQARIIRMQQGDFKTAYGITEIRDVSKFGAAYYSATKLEEEKK